MNNLTKIAALPGSGGGCMSALPAETNRVKPKEPAVVGSLIGVWTSVGPFFGYPAFGYAVGPMIGEPIEPDECGKDGQWCKAFNFGRAPDMLDAAGGGE